MKKVLLATGYEKLDALIQKINGFQVEHTIYKKSEFVEAIDFFKPDTVIVSDYLTGNELLIGLLVDMKQRYPQLEILYLTIKVQPNEVERMNQLASLVMVGIYPILIEGALNRGKLEYYLTNPPTREDVEFLLEHYHKENKKRNEFLELDLDDFDAEDLEDGGYSNVFLVSSIKPGTGKSFIGVNLAMTIAKYGKKKDNGKPPRVALVEADLQNLSLGTLLGYEDDDKHNLKTAIDAIRTILDEEGNLIEDSKKIEKVDDFILSCFRRQYDVPNLEALVGSQLTMEELEHIEQIHYQYLIDLIADNYDVVIIDSNSSLAHTTTLPILQLSNRAYYVLNLDFNNIRNNVRYQQSLQGLGVLDKVSYILNEDYNMDYLRMYNLEEPEKIVFDANAVEEAGFHLSGRIPLIPKSVFLNRLFDGKPICLDEEEYTVLPRLEISKIANEMWEIENLDWLQKEWNRQLEKLYGKKKGLFRR